MYVLENQEPGETAIRFIVPVLRGEEIEGFLASSMRSTTVFSAAAMPSSRVAGLHVQVQCDGQHVYGGPAEPGELAAFGVVAPLPSLPGPRRWVVVVTPGPDYAPAQGSELAEVVLGVSLLTALLLSVSVHSTQEESARAERLETAVRKRTAELARSLLGLRQADEAKDRFISMLGHELRNPLGAVLSATELMPAEHHQHSRALDVIDKEGAHLRRILDDLLDVSRIGEGRLALAREPVELRELARDVVEAHRLMIDAAVELRLPTSPVWIHADATRIRQALGNLIANAAKVSRADDRILLRLASDETKGVAEVRVIDEGPGIDPAEVDRFFEPFVQSQHSMRRDQVGLGLGLSIVKGLVEAHDGRVRVNCKSAGSGAEFIIEVPLADTSILSQARERAGPVAEDDRQIAPTGGLSVLLIERRQT